MSINLPRAIAAYFIADQAGNEAIAECFTDNAVVKDENHQYTGIAAIKQWKKDSAAKYTYTSEPFAIEEQSGMTIVTSKVAGNFPGSPVNLRYRFALADNKIASLEITV